MDVITKVLSIAYQAAAGPARGRKLYTMVVLDVQNAFNSASWPLIDTALRQKLVPPTLVILLCSYITQPAPDCGRHRGTISLLSYLWYSPRLGPWATIMDIFYDRLFLLKISYGAPLVAFADDVAVITVAHKYGADGVGDKFCVECDMPLDGV